MLIIIFETIVIKEEPKIAVTYISYEVNSRLRVMVKQLTTLPINHIAEGIGLKNFTKFVEKENIFNSVRDLNVDYVQGFYLSHPELLMKLIKP